MQTQAESEVAHESEEVRSVGEFVGDPSPEPQSSGARIGVFDSSSSLLIQEESAPEKEIDPGQMCAATEPGVAVETEFADAVSPPTVEDGAPAMEAHQPARFHPEMVSAEGGSAISTEVHMTLAEPEACQQMSRTVERQDEVPCDRIMDLSEVPANAALPLPSRALQVDTEPEVQMAVPTVEDVFEANLLSDEQVPVTVQASPDGSGCPSLGEADVAPLLSPVPQESYFPQKGEDNPTEHSGASGSTNHDSANDEREVAQMIAQSVEETTCDALAGDFGDARIVHPQVDTLEKPVASAEKLVEMHANDLETAPAETSDERGPHAEMLEVETFQDEEPLEEDWEFVAPDAPDAQEEDEWGEWHTADVEDKARECGSAADDDFTDFVSASAPAKVVTSSAAALTLFLPPPRLSASPIAVSGPPCSEGEPVVVDTADIVDLVAKQEHYKRSLSVEEMKDDPFDDTVGLLNGKEGVSIDDWSRGQPGAHDGIDSDSETPRKTHERSTVVRTSGTPRDLTMVCDAQSSSPSCLMSPTKEQMLSSEGHTRSPSPRRSGCDVLYSPAPDVAPDRSVRNDDLCDSEEEVVGARSAWDILCCVAPPRILERSTSAFFARRPAEPVLSFNSMDSLDSAAHRRAGNMRKEHTEEIHLESCGCGTGEADMAPVPGRGMPHTRTKKTSWIEMWC